MITEQMSRTHPQATAASAELVACIAACYECGDACNECSDACLGEHDSAMLRRCIRLCADCADICLVTGRVLSRLTDPDPLLLQAQLEACAIACDICGSECERHAGHHQHCRICAEACRRCEQLCRDELIAV